MIAALGCGGSESNGNQNDAGETVCAGDRWGANPAMLAAIVNCTTITGNLSLTGRELVTVALPQLTRVDGFLTVWGNPALTRVSLPLLASIGGYLDVSFNPALSSLELPALTSVNERAIDSAYDLLIRDNALPTCQTDAIREQLLASGFHGTASVSGDDGACPP